MFKNFIKISIASFSNILSYLNLIIIRKIIYFNCLILFLSYQNILATRIHPSAGTTSATFLKIGVGARATALSYAYSSIADDPTGIYWNPAALTQFENSKFTIMHNEHFQKIRHNFIGFTKKISDYYFGIGTIGLYTEKELEKRTGLSEPTTLGGEPSPIETHFGAYDLALFLSLGQKISTDFSYGISLKPIRQTIGNDPSHAFAVDLGILKQKSLHIFTNNLGFPPLWRFSFTIQNFGTAIRFLEKAYNLPLTFRMGNSLTNNNLLLSLDLTQPIDDYLSVAFGFEYKIFPVLSFRSGYRYKLFDKPFGTSSGYSVGVGFNFKDFSIDYAFLPYGVLGQSHRLSLTYKFPMKIKIEPPKVILPQLKPIEFILPASLQTEKMQKIELLPQNTQKTLIVTRHLGGEYKFKAEISDMIFDEINFQGFVPQGGEVVLFANEVDVNISTSAYKFFVFQVLPKINIKKVYGSFKIPKNIENIKLVKFVNNEFKELEISKLSFEEEFVYYLGLLEEEGIFGIFVK